MITVLDDEGKPDASLLADYEGTGDLVFYVFDLLSFEGESWLNRSLIERKEMLLNVLKKFDIFVYSDDFANGGRLFAKIKEMGLGGVIAKRKTSLYTSGDSSDWVVIKVEGSEKPVKTMRVNKEVPKFYDALMAHLKDTRERTRQTIVKPIMKT